MSRKYEGLIVLNTKSTEGTSVEELVNAVSKEIEAEGAKLDEVQQIGRRKFAYNSRHLESGHYVNYFFKAEPAAIDRISAKLKLNESVHLQHFQRVA
ncbi:30S ribosomal protein S6 [Luteolibacter sp. GHJ8]|jgi:small subunit ribosomal protein S6|uniref:Small ribosomal subunit protein bS6 n=1 Tax=Luteolibacter rhizosphaerae TaxID=2989719 RepID=A0ABT3G6M1_9BACT|nr:30S ribosomal protein S6 [Luteolibacter rhizosphaerae]MCW1914885.1 30S ribosomal protein S6 [Luteolibacter rhizosphaerae]